MSISKMKVKVITTNNHNHPPKGIPLLSIPLMSDQRWNELASQKREAKQLEAYRT